MRANRDLRYRPYLDGIRCLAVYLVLAFHAGLGAFDGGFIGVDVFFVLSGYLVTRILLRDLAGLRRIEFRRFYARRVRRILPAACITLVVTAIAYSRVASPAEMFDVLGGFRASFLYVANWYFINQSVSYFAANVNESPVLHFWSLAVEEQFYLLWPLALTALYLLTRRTGRIRWWLLRGAIAAAAIASVVAAIHLASSDVDRAYYGTDTRAYQLLAGALIAITPQLFRWHGRSRRVARVLSIVSTAALVVVATSLIDLGPISRGIVVTVLTCLLIVAIENARGGAATTALSAGPIAYLGRLSYGTYLWHWPIVVIVTHEWVVQPLPLFAISFVFATGLAALSYHFVEHPIRVSSWLNQYRVPVIAGGLMVSLIGGLVFTPVFLDKGSSVASGSKLLDWRAAKEDRIKVPDCVGWPIEKCIIVKGSGKRVLLMGDSHARMWTPAFEAIAKKEDLTLAVAIRPRCPWQRGLNYGTSKSEERTDCLTRQADWYDRIVPEFDPDVLVVANQAYDDPGFPQSMVLPNGTTAPATTAGTEKALKSATRRAVRSLEHQGRQIVIMEPIPMAPDGFNPLNCISAGGPLSKCEYRASKGQSPLEKYYRSLTAPKGAVSSASGERGRVLTLDLDHLVCPRLPICDPVVHDIIVKRDPTHLTATFSSSLSSALEKRLRVRKVLGDSG